LSAAALTAAAAEPTTVVTVPRTRLDPGSVPQVCCKTGERAQCLVPTVASTIPRWAWVLMALGGVPFLAARRWLFPREVLTLPARNSVADRWQLVTRATVGCFAVAAVLLLWGVFTLSPTAVLAAVFVGAVTTAVWWLLTPTVWVQADLVGSDIRLSGVHVGAARALSGATPGR
jgi:hypothetical protein